MKVFELRITCVTCPDCGEDLRDEGCDDGGHEATALECLAMGEEYTLEFEGGHALAQSILNHARSELERNGLIGGLI